MTTYSEITHMSYKTGDCVYFKNILQSFLYCSNGAKIQDILLDKKEKRFVFVFLREDHDKLREAWNRHELQ